MKKNFGLLLLVCLSASVHADEKPIGFQLSTLSDAQNERPLEMAVWYPATTTAAPQLIADTPVFIGTRAVRDAAPVAGSHPLVVFSHGYRGNWANQAWLASALAQQGYIVAAANHPGTTTHDLSAQAATQFWQRPADIRRVIDAVTAAPERFGAVAKGRVAVAGHSLGGWTALEIAGARFDAERFATQCNAHPQLAPCIIAKKIDLASDAASKTRLNADLSDPRVTAIISLDLGFSRGFTDQSLAALSLPVLVIAAGAPSDDLPAPLESADLAKRLPSTSSKYVEIKDASHFSFLSECRPGAAAMLNEEAPGDGVICEDGGGRSREQIQQQVASLISDFLARPQ